MYYGADPKSFFWSLVLDNIRFYCLNKSFQHYLTSIDARYSFVILRVLESCWR